MCLLIGICIYLGKNKLYVLYILILKEIDFVGKITRIQHDISSGKPVEDTQ